MMLCHSHDRGHDQTRPVWSTECGGWLRWTGNDAIELWPEEPEPRTDALPSHSEWGITRCARRRPTGGACTPSPGSRRGTSIRGGAGAGEALRVHRRGRRDGGGRFAVQPICLDQPGTSGRIPERASKVPSGLGVIVGLFRPAASIPATASPRNRMSFMITFGLASTR